MSEQKQDAELRAKFEAWAATSILNTSESFKYPGMYEERDTECAFFGFRAAASLFAKDAERLREALRGLVLALKPMEAYFVSPSTNREVSDYFNTLDRARAALEREPK